MRVCPEDSRRGIYRVTRGLFTDWDPLPWRCKSSTVVAVGDFFLSTVWISLPDLPLFISLSHALLSRIHSWFSFNSVVVFFTFLFNTFNLFTLILAYLFLLGHMSIVITFFLFPAFHLPIATIFMCFLYVQVENNVSDKIPEWIIMLITDIGKSQPIPDCMIQTFHSLHGSFLIFSLL